MCEKSSMPTDEQIAELGKQMRKKAERILKTLDKIQKKAKQQKFTAELWNLAVDVSEKKIKLPEAVAILKTKIPLKSTSFHLSEFENPSWGILPFAEATPEKHRKHAGPMEYDKTRVWTIVKIKESDEEPYEFYGRVFCSGVRKKTSNIFEDKIMELV